MSVAAKLATAALVAIAAWAAMGAAPAPALAQQVQMHRCIGPGGGTIYTDRPCAALGSTDRLSRPAPTPGATLPGGRRTSCSRTLQDLVYEVSAAIDNHDVNRLGGVYHWIGQDQASGDRILDQLQAIVDRPLVDIAVIRRGSSADPPATEAPTAVDAATAPPAPAADADAVDAPDGEPPSPPSTPHATRSVVTGLRIEQTLHNSATPSRTVFGLRRYFDCWWIAF